MRYLLSVLLLLPLSVAWSHDRRPDSYDRRPGSDDRFRVEAIKIDYDHRRNETRVDGVVHFDSDRRERGTVTLEITFYNRGGHELGRVEAEFDDLPARSGRRFSAVARRADLRGWSMYSVKVHSRRDDPPPPPRDRKGRSDQRFRIEGLNFSSGRMPGATRVTGTLQNVSRESFRDARVRVTFWDKNERYLGTIDMRIDRLPAGSSERFDEFADGPNVRDWRHIVVELLSSRSDHPGPGTPPPPPRPGMGLGSSGPGPR